MHARVRAGKVLQQHAVRAAPRAVCQPAAHAAASCAQRPPLLAARCLLAPTSTHLARCCCCCCCLLLLQLRAGRCQEARAAVPGGVSCAPRDARCVCAALLGRARVDSRTHTHKCRARCKVAACCLHRLSCLLQYKEHPANQAVAQLLQSGGIGQLQELAVQVRAASSCAVAASVDVPCREHQRALLQSAALASNLGRGCGVLQVLVPRWAFGKSDIRFQVRLAGAHVLAQCLGDGCRQARKVVDGRPPKVLH